MSHPSITAVKRLILRSPEPCLPSASLSPVPRDILGEILLFAVSSFDDFLRLSAVSHDFHDVLRDPASPIRPYFLPALVSDLVEENRILPSDLDDVETVEDLFRALRHRVFVEEAYMSLARVWRVIEMWHWLLYPFLLVAVVTFCGYRFCRSITDEQLSVQTRNRCLLPFWILGLIEIGIGIFQICLAFYEMRYHPVNLKLPRVVDERAMFAGFGRGKSGQRLAFVLVIALFLFVVAALAFLRYVVVPSLFYEEKIEISAWSRWRVLQFVGVGIRIVFWLAAAGVLMYKCVFMVSFFSLMKRCFADGFAMVRTVQLDNDFRLGAFVIFPCLLVYLVSHFSWVWNQTFWFRLPEPVWLVVGLPIVAATLLHGIESLILSIVLFNSPHGKWRPSAGEAILSLAGAWYFGMGLGTSFSLLERVGGVVFAGGLFSVGIALPSSISSIKRAMNQDLRAGVRSKIYTESETRVLQL